MSESTKERIARIRIKGMADNTVKSYEKDLKYFRGWAAVSKGVYDVQWPVDRALLEDFVLDHLEGLSNDVDSAMVSVGYKRELGRHAVTTVYRRLKAIAWAHRVRDLENPLQNQMIKQVMADARRVESKGGRVAKKSRAITKDILSKMVERINTNDITGARDRAILEFGFYTGGRRRSEIAGAEFRFLTRAPKGGFTYLLHRSKTDQAGNGALKLLRASHAVALKRWIRLAGIRDGYLFRSIQRGNIMNDSILPGTVGQIIKRYVEQIGEDPALYSAHGLRRGFITQCGRDNVPLADTMALSGHRDVKTAIIYYEEGQLWRNRGTKI